MKTKEQRYSQAVERSVYAFTKRIEYYRKAFKTIVATKHALGIRRNDSNYDQEIIGRISGTW